MLFHLKDAISSQFDAPRPEALVVTRLEVETQSVLYFFFRERSPRPFAVVKAAGDPGSVQKLEHEYGNVSRVTDRLPGRLRGTVPRLHGEGRILDHYYFIQDYIEGMMLPEEIETDRRGDPKGEALSRIDLAWNWLDDFQAATAGTVRPLHEFGLGRVIDRYAEAYGESPEEGEYIGWLGTRLDELRDVGVIEVACHGDLFPGNVIIGETGVTVIDWRDYRPVHHPVYDIATLLTTFRVPFRHVDDIEGNLEATLLDGNGIRRRLRSGVESLLRARGIGHEAFELLFGLSILEWATDEYSQEGVVTGKDLIWRRRLRHYAANRERFEIGR